MNGDRRSVQRSALATGVALLVVWSAVCLGGAEVLGVGPAAWHGPAPWLIWGLGAAVIMTAVALGAARRQRMERSD